MSDASGEEPTTPINTAVTATSDRPAIPRGLLWAVIGLGAAILAALVVVIVILVTPKPPTPELTTEAPAPEASPTFVATLPPTPTATAAPIPSATPAPPPTPEPDAPDPAPEEPQPGFTSLDVVVFDGDGISVKDACAALLPKAPQDKDHVTIAISWKTEDIQFVEGTLNGSTPSGWAYLDPNGYVFAQLDCFTNDGSIWGTNFELRAYDFAGYDVDVLEFRVKGNGEIGSIS